MTTGQNCKVEREGPLCVVTLNRPERLNTLDGDTHAELEVLWNFF